MLILGIQGRGGGGMEIDEQAKAQDVVSPWSTSAYSSSFRRQSLHYFILLELNYLSSRYTTRIRQRENRRL